MNEKFLQYSDEQLVTLAQQQDSYAVNEIILRYLQTVRIMACKYRLPGVAVDDVVQEGLLGLVKATRLYDSGKSSFKTFATLCIQSSMLSFVRQVLSLKNQPLANFSPLDQSELGLLEDNSQNPEEILLGKEQVKNLMEKINVILSPLEQQTLKLYLSGHSYIEISTILSTSSKAVDNALQRVRRKLQSVL